MNNLSVGYNFFRGRFFLLLGACLSVYFSYHAVAGQRSVVKLHQLKGDVVLAVDEADALSAEGDKLRKKVSMLRSDSLDSDYVEELAMYYLGYRKPAAFSVLYSGE